MRRLRTILTLQRDEYLPLDVIRQRVDRVVTAAPGQPLDPTATPLPITPVLKREEPVYTWEEAPEAAGVDNEFFRMLAEYRLVERSGSIRARPRRKRSGDRPHLSPFGAFWSGAA